MRDLFTVAGVIVGALGLGIVMAVLLMERFGNLCPVCNGILMVDEGSVTCTRCGKKFQS